MDVRGKLALWPLIVLCMVLGTRWVLTDQWPGTQTTISSEALAALLAACGCLVLARMRGRVAREPTHWPWRAAAAGALLFAGLNAGLIAGDASPKANDLLIALAIAPAVVAVALISRGEAGPGLNGIDIAPGILAPAGLLLILSQPAFRSGAEDAVLVGAPLCAGMGTAWLAARRDEAFTPQRATVALGGAAVLFAALSLHGPHARPAWAATALDLAVIVLTVGSLARLGARRVSAQFALVPLLLLLEGLALVRVRPDWQQVGGLAMLLVASVLLLRRTESAEAVDSPRLLT